MDAYQPLPLRCSLFFINCDIYFWFVFVYCFALYALCLCVCIEEEQLIIVRLNIINQSICATDDDKTCLCIVLHPVAMVTLGIVVGQVFVFRYMIHVVRRIVAVVCYIIIMQLMSLLLGCAGCHIFDITIYHLFTRLSMQKSLPKPLQVSGWFIAYITKVC